MRRLFLLVLVLVVAACTPVSPQPIGPAPTPTAAPARAPAATAAPVIDLAPPVDLAPYRATMKSGFIAEIDRFGNAPRYQIDLTIAPDHRTYTATQQVHYTNLETETLQEIPFLLYPNLSSYGGHLNVESVKLNGETVTPQLKPGHVVMKIDLPEPLKPGEAIDVELAYSARVPVLDVKTGYNQFGLHDDILTLPNFYPQIPAYDDEGWNITLGPGYGDAVFSDTALYQVNLTAPAEDVVVASGSCTTALGKQTQTVRCASGPMRDFMLAASPDFKVWSTVVDGVKINSYAREAFADGGERALQSAQQAVQSYEKRIGPYPFAELDVVGTPTTAGGIEYPGLIVIAEDVYNQGGMAADFVVAHEVAHQWWYSLVGNDQVDEPWLDESLTQFTAALYGRDWYGQRRMDELTQEWRMVAQQIKNTPVDKRADLSVADYTDENQYGAVVYEKAPLFFNAIYEAIGDAKFNHLLQDYFAQQRYGVAYPQDFLKVAEEYVGKTKLDELVKEWIETP
jgi:hypothetical protein